MIVSKNASSLTTENPMSGQVMPVRSLRSLRFLLEQANLQIMLQTGRLERVLVICTTPLLTRLV